MAMLAQVMAAGSPMMPLCGVIDEAYAAFNVSINTPTEPHALACQLQCMEETDCKAFTYDRTSKLCYIQTSVVGLLQATPGVVSGPPSCGLVSLSYKGSHDMKELEGCMHADFGYYSPPGEVPNVLTAQDPLQCRSLCLSQPTTCVFWTWQMSLADLNCNLLAAIPAGAQLAKMVGVVSGPSHCNQKSASTKSAYMSMSAQDEQLQQLKSQLMSKPKSAIADGLLEDIQELNQTLIMSMLASKMNKNSAVSIRLGLSPQEQQDMQGQLAAKIAQFKELPPQQQQNIEREFKATLGVSPQEQQAIQAQIAANSQFKGISPQDKQDIQAQIAAKPQFKGMSSQDVTGVTPQDVQVIKQDLQADKGQLMGMSKEDLVNQVVATKTATTNLRASAVALTPANAKDLVAPATPKSTATVPTVDVGLITGLFAGVILCCVGTMVAYCACCHPSSAKKVRGSKVVPEDAAPLLSTGQDSLVSTSYSVQPVAYAQQPASHTPLVQQPQVYYQAAQAMPAYQMQAAPVSTGYVQTYQAAPVSTGFRQAAPVSTMQVSGHGYQVQAEPSTYSSYVMQ